MDFVPWSFRYFAQCEDSWIWNDSLALVVYKGELRLVPNGELVVRHPDRTVIRHRPCGLVETAGRVRSIHVGEAISAYGGDYFSDIISAGIGWFRIAQLVEVSERFEKRLAGGLPCDNCDADVHRPHDATRVFEYLRPARRRHLNLCERCTSALGKRQ